MDGFAALAMTGLASILMSALAMIMKKSPPLAGFFNFSER